MGLLGKHCKTNVLEIFKKDEQRWLTPIFLATQEAEISRIRVQSQPGQIVCETLSGKNPSQKRAGGVAQGVGSEFKPQYHKKKKKKVTRTKRRHGKNEYSI
jgi:hypothetical protein